MLGVCTFALVVSVSAGTPDAGEYPPVAMGSVILLHTLRAGLFLGVAGAVLLIGWRATAGDFPIRFANVEYSAKRTAIESERTDATHARRLLVLEVLAGIRSASDLENERGEG